MLSSRDKEEPNDIDSQFDALFANKPTKSSHDDEEEEKVYPLVTSKFMANTLYKSRAANLYNSMHFLRSTTTNPLAFAMSPSNSGDFNDNEPIGFDPNDQEVLQSPNKVVVNDDGKEIVVPMNPRIIPSNDDIIKEETTDENPSHVFRGWNRSQLIQDVCTLSSYDLSSLRISSDKV